MKTEKNILTAFLLNFLFAVFEIVGVLFIGSVAILSDAIHDAGDSLSIGLSYFLERKSRKEGEEKYSVWGSLITGGMLFAGSVFAIVMATVKLFIPSEINYDGMIIFAVAGILVNGIAAYFTHEGDSLNQKAVNLHMFEDLLGWILVLFGAIAMKFTDFTVIDRLLSIGISVFIMVNSAKIIVKGMRKLKFK